MSKLLENTFRSVNIALVNELAMLCERMGGINVWEVIEAASTKPFGFMPFYPGPGVGGHCILIDPHYLAWKAREYDFYTRFIYLSAEVNENMPHQVKARILALLAAHGKRSKDAKVLFLGVAFKKDIKDIRHSPGLIIMGLLKPIVGEVLYHDPYVECVEVGGVELYSVPLTEELLRSVDIVVITTDHTNVDYQMVLNNASLILDTRNAIKGKASHLYHLGYVEDV